MADLPVIHPKFREWPTPAYGVVAERNPPTLMWPASNADPRSYRVRLSNDPDFPPESTIEGTGLGWSIFNPHRPLKPGVWYWQVKEAEGPWSEPYTFRIGVESLPWNPPTATVLNAAVPAYRPRLLVDAPELAAFRARAAGTGEAARILGRAEAVVEEEPPEEGLEIRDIRGANRKETEKLKKDASEEVGQGLYAGVRPLCEAYVITGDSRFAEAAVRWALKAANWDPEGVTHLSDFGDSRIMLSMAMVYDTLQDYLSPEEARQLKEAAGTRAQQFYEHYLQTNQELKLLSGHLWQHILHYIFDTAIALHGDDPRADNWLAWAYEVFLARAPLLGGGDGGWAEGLSYLRMNMEMLIDIPWRVFEYTGFDFIRSTPWYDHNVDLLLYGFPPGSRSAGFADNTHELPEPRGDYLAYADALARLLNNPYAAWYRDRILELTPDLTPYYQAYWRSHFVTDEAVRDGLEDTRLLSWQRLRYLYELPSPAPRAPVDLPMSQVFRGEGFVAMHGRSLEKGPEHNLFVAMRSSPFGVYGHMLADHNTFNLVYGGERLFYHTGYKVAMSAPHRRLYYMNTKSHNGILVDGEGQPYHTEAFGWMEHFLESERLSYAVGNASRAYDSPTEGYDAGVRTFRRHVLLLRPDILVVYDELEAAKPVTWTYLLHSYNQIRIDPEKSHLVVETSKGRGDVRLLASTDVEWAVTDEYPVPARNWRGIRDKEGNLIEYPNDAWHFSANSKKTRGMRFLAFYRVSSTDKVEEHPQQDFVREIAPGEFQLGNWEVRAALKMDEPAFLAARHVDGTLAFAGPGGNLRYVEGLSFKGSRQNARIAELRDNKWHLQENPPEIPPGATIAIRHFQRQKKTITE